MDVFGVAQAVRKVCIFDFDVHHGNGTEAIVKNLVPSTAVKAIALPMSTITVETPMYRPWLDEKVTPCAHLVNTD